MNQPLPAAATTRFGPIYRPSGECVFRLYAPGVSSLAVELDDASRHPMQASEGGWFETTLQCEPGTHYRFILPDGTAVPDPAARAQSSALKGASVVCDADSYAWQETEWRGRPWQEMVIYELHVGLFGGFDGVREHLPRLASFGITAIELMPIADFEGAHNWGYDGVLLFAPSVAYGTPEDLRALIDAAHALGMCVILDVVYNHFGPRGNYLSLYAPTFFRDDIHTPWGAALDFRRAEVRDFYFENALYWLRDVRFDGLRFDAVHTIEDDGWLSELPQRLRAALPERHIHLILENDHNSAELIAKGYSGQWNDDFHHAVHVMLTGEVEAYYQDYAEEPAAQLARVLAEGFAYQGEPSIHRDGAKRGSPSGALPPRAFVSFLQNHDQIGNRARGERLCQLTTREQLEAAFALLLLSPQTPMLFMGEEINSAAPFYFFADFDGELGEAVRRGRRAEFKRFAAFAELADLVPDPLAPKTFTDSRVQWPALCDEDSATLRHTNMMRALLTLRQQVLVPRFLGVASLGACSVGAKAVLAQWQLNDGQHLSIYANLGGEDNPIAEAIASHARLLWESAAGAFEAARTDRLMSGSTVAWLTQPRLGAATRRIR